MTEKKYHHGNLKNELIEKGLEYIDKNGVDNLSMRKLAKICDVSSAAPYAHFANKEEYLSEVQNHIMGKLTISLKCCMENVIDPRRLLVELGKDYVLFFRDNPLYYRFIFFYGNVNLEVCEPYQFFVRISEDFLKAAGVPEKDIKYKTMAMWSMVHGLAGISSMDGVYEDGRVGDEIEKILCAVSL